MLEILRLCDMQKRAGCDECRDGGGLGRGLERGDLDFRDKS
jgi:hypothetical protein